MICDKCGKPMVEPEDTYMEIDGKRSDGTPRTLRYKILWLCPDGHFKSELVES